MEDRAPLSLMIRGIGFWLYKFLIYYNEEMRVFGAIGSWFSKQYDNVRIGYNKMRLRGATKKAAKLWDRIVVKDKEKVERDGAGYAASNPFKEMRRCIGSDQEHEKVGDDEIDYLRGSRKDKEKLKRLNREIESIFSDIQGIRQGFL